MRHYNLVLILLLVVVLTGCSRDSGLHGKWVFDREYTEQHLQEEAQKKEQTSQSIGGALKPMLMNFVAPALLLKMDGVTLSITNNEIMYISKNGSGQSQVYEVIERPGKDVWRIKTADGKIRTFHRDGERLATGSDEEVDFEFYFKRSSQ